MAATSSPKITDAFWKDTTAGIGDGVDMIVSLSGIKKSSSITFTVFEVSSDGNRMVEELELKNVPKGATSARLLWIVKYKAEVSVTRGFPEYSFTAKLSPGASSKSVDRKKLLNTGKLDKPTWKAKPGTKTPQPADGRFTAFFTRTEAIDMIITGDGFRGFVFDFHIFTTLRGASQPTYLDTVRGIQSQGPAMVTAEWSLERVDNPGQYIDLPFNFTYSFRLENEAPAAPPSQLPSSNEYVANQAKCVGLVSLKLLRFPASITRSDRTLDYFFEVTGGSDDFPLTMGGVTRDVNVTVNPSEPLRIDKSPLEVKLPLFAPKTSEPQKGTMLVFVADAGYPVKNTIVAQITIDVIFNEKILFQLNYPPARKMLEVDTAYLSDLPMSVHIDVINPQLIPVDIDLSIEQTTGAGDYKIHTRRKAFTGNSFDDIIVPGDYQVAAIFRARVQAFYEGELLAELFIEYTPPAGRVKLESQGLISTSFKSGMFYELPFTTLRDGTLDTAMLDVEIEEFDNGVFMPVPVSKLFSQLEFNPSQVMFNSQNNPDTQDTPLLLQSLPVTSTTLVKVIPKVGVNDPTNTITTVSVPPSFQFNLNP